MAYELQGSIPARQSMWGWKIAAYLFGAGMGAGAYAVGGVEMLVGSFAGSAIGARAMWLGAIVALISPGFLIWELGNPQRFLYVFRRPNSSWLSRGAFILVAFGIAAATTWALGAPKALVELSVILAITVATYTGILLGTMLARPVWNSSVLPGIFLVSGLSTGIALLDFWRLAVASGAGPSQTITAATGRLLPVHVGLLVIELVLIFLLLYISYGRAPGAVEMVVRGSISKGFWMIIVGFGLVLPIVLLGVASSTTGDTVRVVTSISDVGVIIGGYWLRRVILYAGTRGQVQMGLVPFVIRPGV